MPGQEYTGGKRRSFFHGDIFGRPRFRRTKYAHWTIERTWIFEWSWFTYWWLTFLSSIVSLFGIASEINEINEESKNRLTCHFWARVSNQPLCVKGIYRRIDEYLIGFLGQMNIRPLRHCLNITVVSVVRVKLRFDVAKADILKIFIQIVLTKGNIRKMSWEPRRVRRCVLSPVLNGSLRNHTGVLLSSISPFYLHRDRHSLPLCWYSGISTLGTKFYRSEQ